MRPKLCPISGPVSDVWRCPVSDGPLFREEGQFRTTWQDTARGLAPRSSKGSRKRKSREGETAAAAPLFRPLKKTLEQLQTGARDLKSLWLISSWSFRSKRYLQGNGVIAG